MPDPTENINKCPSCGFPNDPVRVYCRECGAKLNPPPATTAAPISSTQVRRPPARPAFQMGDLFRHGWALLRLAVYAALAAAIIQMLRAPDSLVPPAPELKPDQVAATQEALRRGASGTGTIQLPQAIVNSYLATQLKPADTSGSGSYRVEFIRVFSLISKERFRLVMERAIRRYPIFLTLDLQPVSKNGGTDLTITGGQIGRLPLPAILAQLLGRSFSGMAEPLSYELKLLATASKVELGDQRALVTWSGSPNP